MSNQPPRTTPLTLESSFRASVGLCALCVWFCGLPPAAQAFEADLLPARFLRDAVFVSLHPEEHTILAEMLDDDGGADIFAVPIDRAGEPQRLTFLGDAASPLYSPDGERIAFVHNGSVFVMEDDGSRKLHLADLAATGEKASMPASWLTNEHLLVYGAEWPAKSKEYPEFTGHILVQEVGGDRKWVSGVNAENGPTEAVGNPLRPRMAWVLDGRLMTVGLDLEQMSLIGLADPNGPVQYSPDGQTLAYTHEGNLRLSTADGGQSWDLGRGFSPTWPQGGGVCLFLRDTNSGSEVMVWRRQLDTVLPLSAVLREQERVLASLDATQRQVNNLIDCLRITHQQATTKAPGVARLARAFRTLEDDEYLAKTNRVEAFGAVMRQLSDFQEQLDWRTDSIDVIVQRLRNISHSIGHLRHNLSLGIDHRPYAEHLAGLADGIEEVSGEVEARTLASLSLVPRQRRVVQEFSKAFGQAKNELIAAEEMAARQSEERAEQLRQERFRMFLYAVAAVAGLILLWYLLASTYRLVIEPKLRMRRIKRQYDSELQEELGVVRETLQKASSDLRSRKKKEVAWQEILNSTQTALNDVFRETHKRELERIEKLGDFYQRVTGEIIRMDIPEDQKVELLEAFKGLMRQGVEDTNDATPFQRRLKDIYTQIAND